jgi:hypothetical protein
MGKLEQALVLAGILSATAAVGSVAASAAQEEDANLKKRICNAVGCPDTQTRLCAEVQGEVSFPFFSGSVNYQCYEPEV